MGFVADEDSDDGSTSSSMNIDDNNTVTSLNYITLCGTVNVRDLSYRITPMNTAEITHDAPYTLSRRWKILETKLLQIYQEKGEGFFCNSGWLVELRDYLFMTFENEHTVVGFVTIEPFILRNGWSRASWTDPFDNNLPKKLQIQFLESYVKGVGSALIEFAKDIASTKGFEIIEAVDILPETEGFWTANDFQRGFPGRYDESSTFFVQVDCVDHAPHDINPLEFDASYFRLNKPYGLYIHKTQPITVPFNRFYRTLGSTQDFVQHPTEYLQVFLYNDATLPWESLENHAQYEKRYAEIIPNDDICRICNKSCVENTSRGTMYHVAEGEWIDPKPVGYIDHWIPTSHFRDYGTTIAFCDKCCDKWCDEWYGNWCVDDEDPVIYIQGARFRMFYRNIQRYNE